LKYKGKSLLKYKLEVIPDEINEIIIVIGYLGEKIKEELGDEYMGVPLRYVVQKELLGTAHALFECREYLDENFLVLMGDDVYNKEDIFKLSKSKNWSILVEKTSDIDINNEMVQKLLNGPVEGLTYTGACFLTPEVFNLDMVKIKGLEYGLPQTISSQTERIEVITTKNWVRITNPDDLYEKM
jgi:bifunctional UDP-N-acetylglucosamine pyrophosphorylase/glucosamine-1-phosphate N-acetyltransferase